MSIGNVRQKGQAIYVYDERGQQLAVLSAGYNGELAGFTSKTVNMEKDGTIYSYDEKGRQLAVYPA